MRVPRIFTDQQLASNSRISLEPEPSHHLSQVLRLTSGDALKLFNGDGMEYAASIAQLSKRQVSADVGRLLRSEPRPTLRIQLILGISRGTRMEFALQKAVELGVTGLYPVFSDRCVVKLSGKRLEARLDHWRKLVINACEQSGRCRLPHLNAPESLTSSVQYERPGISLLLDHRSRQTPNELTSPDGSVHLLVGPEGGLSESERSMALKHGFIGIRLGPRILRTETAPLAAIAALQTLWGDFRPQQDD